MRLAPWLLASFSVCLCGACNKTQPPPFKPIAEVKELMNDILDPAADDVWGASGWIETKDGVVQRGPQNNEEWTAVRNRAMTVAEAGNLLMIVPRAKDGGQWMTFARALVDKGEECVKAADARTSNACSMWVGSSIKHALTVTSSTCRQSAMRSRLLNERRAALQQGRADSNEWESPTRRLGGQRIGGMMVSLSRRARALRRLLSGVFLLHTRAVEGPEHCLVSLVAGVLVDLVLGALQEQRGRPRLGPGRRIVDGHLVLQRLGVDAAEPLDEMQLLAGAASTDRGVAAEVGRIDDK